MSKKVLLPFMIVIGVLLILFTAAQYRQKVHQDKVLKFANEVNVCVVEAQRQMDSVDHEYRMKKIEAIYGSTYTWRLDLAIVKVEENDAKIFVFQKYMEKRKAIDMNAKAEGVTEDEYMKHVDQILTGI